MNWSERGWRLIQDGTDRVPRVEVWRKGSEPFCIEVEVWETGAVRGRLCAPGMKICGTMIFELPDEEQGAEFLEKLLEGATKAVFPQSVNGPSEQT